MYAPTRLMHMMYVVFPKLVPCVMYTLERTPKVLYMSNKTPPNIYQDMLT